MRRLFIVPHLALVFLAASVACSGGSAEGEADAMDAPDPDAAVPVFSACPAGEYAVGFNLDGTLRCGTVDLVAKEAMTQHCSLFFGWADNCDGCTTIPTKWGRVSGQSCLVGAGLDNTCQMVDLAGITLQLLGLNTDGDVNDDDKFHIGLECTPPTDDPVPGPCPPGTFLTSIADGGMECATGQAAMVDYFANGCKVYYGWRDNCDGCTSAPLKWGTADSEECVVGDGINTTCSSFNLDNTPVFMLGVNTDGTVNGDDKFYLGFQCNDAMPSEGRSTAACPPGEFIVEIDAQGIRCESPVPAAEVAVRDGCYLYHGWRDGCNGCSQPPSKWGRVSHNTCENGEGADNTCASTPLDGTSVQLLGINTDGDVDGNDTFSLGLSCP